MSLSAAPGGDMGRRKTTEPGFSHHHFGFGASTIAAIYKERWQIELFFKALKQHLKIKTFLGTSENAVMTQIWVALITYLMLAFLRFQAGLGLSFPQLLRLLQINLFDRRTLVDLCHPQQRH